MADLKPCKRCGGKPEHYNEYIETAFGDRPCIAIRCTKCKARTSRYMCADPSDRSIIEIVEDLWNRGRIGGADNG